MKEGRPFFFRVLLEVVYVYKDISISKKKRRRKSSLDKEEKDDTERKGEAKLEACPEGDAERKKERIPPPSRRRLGRKRGNRRLTVL